MTDNLPVLRSRTTAAIATPPASESDAMLSVELRKAHVLATKSGDAIPKSYRGNDGAILLAMDWADKRGLDLITALQSVSFINGRPVIDASMLRALAKQAGYRVIVTEATDTVATVEVSENGELIGRASFTVEDAKAANLLGKENWKTYREDMLVARATSRAIRRYAADVMVGLSLPDEVVGAGEVGFSVDTMNVQAEPVPTQDAGPGEVDNGDGVGSAAGPADPGPVRPISQGEAVRVTNLRTGIRGMIKLLDDDGIAKLREHMGVRKLDDMGGDELIRVQRLVASMLPPDEVAEG